MTPSGLENENPPLGLVELREVGQGIITKVKDFTQKTKSLTKPVLSIQGINLQRRFFVSCSNTKNDVGRLDTGRS